MYLQALINKKVIAQASMLEASAMNIETARQLVAKELEEQGDVDVSSLVFEFTTRSNYVSDWLYSYGLLRSIALAEKITESTKRHGMSYPELTGKAFDIKGIRTESA